MERSWPEWELYERLVARLIANQVSSDLCVTPNARIVGRISKTARQIDVLIDARHDTDNSRRIVVDAKKRRRKIDVKDVEEFRGLMEDVGATHGYLVSTSGHTKAAEKRAQKAVSIRILPLDRLEDFDPSTWPRCKDSRCKHGRIFWDGYPQLTMTLQSLSDSSEAGLKHFEYIYYVGKCDRCSRFHVWCSTCDDLFFVVEDDEDDFGRQCQCRRPWLWLASVEEDDDGDRSAELHVCTANGFMTVDRRSL